MCVCVCVLFVFAFCQVGFVVFFVAFSQVFVTFVTRVTHTHTHTLINTHTHTWHGGRDTHYRAILRGDVDQRVGEHLGQGRIRARLGE